jgi:hypothetical protein
VNQGLGEALGQTLVVLNNDTIVPPGWLDRLHQHLSDPGVGLVGPCTNAAPNESRIATDYRTYGEFVRFAARRAIEEAGRVREMDVLTMFCVAFRRETFDSLGPLDEQFEVGMFEDDDYSERARAAGLRLVCAEDVVVHHFGEASFGALVTHGAYAQIFDANKRRFEEKWNRRWVPHRSREDLEYDHLVESVRALIVDTVPAGETVLVVSKGDEGLVELEGRVGWHFPRGADGAFAGWYPADLRELRDQLDTLRSKGARFLVFPRTAAWWFEFYEGLEQLLDAEYEEVRSEHGCRVFVVRETTAARRAS